jgi:Uma2 family endonuclease
LDHLPATIADLARTEGQAELIGGQIVSYPPSGWRAGLVAGNIHTELHEYARRVRRGYVFMATLGYVIPELPSGRQSFYADASYYVGPLPSDPMGFIEGPPTLAIEIRDVDDVGEAAESAMAAKRADYFLAGTLVVWDVDPVAETIDVYRADSPGDATTYVPGQVAEAEPAAPGWQVDVDRIFA